MKKWFHVFFIAAAAVSCLALPVHAQDDELDDFDFEELDEEETSVPYFAVAAGFTPTWYFPNLDEVNTAMQSLLPEREFTTPIFMTGWQGFLGIGLVDNVRIGFVNVSGSLTEEGTATVTVNNNDETVNRRFEYGVTFSGLTVDYAFTFGSSFAVLPGIMVGWGTLSMDASQSRSVRDFQDRIFDFDGTEAVNRYRHLEAAHISLQINLNLEYAVTRFAMLRLNAGYVPVSEVGDWEADLIQTVDNVPADIEPNGLTVQAGIFLGLFY